MRLSLLLPLCVCSSLFAQPALRLGEPAGPIEMVSPEGATITMNNYGERVATAVLFLSTRDQGTEQTAGSIVQLNAKFRHSGILLLGIFPDASASPGEIRAFCQAHGFNFPVYRDPGGQTVKRFGASVTPESFVLDREGKLLFRGAVESAGGSGLAEALQAVVAHKNMPASQNKVAGTAIGTKLPARKPVDPYGAIHFTSELVFDEIPGYPVHHCASITEAPNGDLLISWYGGSYESSDDQVLFLARQKKGERTWSKPEILVRSAGKPPGNAVLFTDPARRVWMVWGRMDGTQPMMRGKGWDACQLFYRTSADSGRTWSGDQPFYRDTLGWLPRNLTFTTSKGALILPLSDERNGHAVDLSFFLSTTDNGKTWSRSGIMRGGEQPTIIERSNGSLVAYLRNRPNILAAESNDGGKTWSTPRATQWKNPDSGISMRRLSNGHVLLVFNNQDHGRSPLHIARSIDEGRTWEAPLQLETNPGEYSYPSVLQTSDGKIHIIYTFRRYSIKHLELNEDWLTKMERPD